MYTLEITESAEADLDQITEYLGIELSNPPAALAVLDEVGQVSDALEVTPEMFPLCADSRNRRVCPHAARLSGEGDFGGQDFGGQTLHDCAHDASLR